MMLKLRPYKSCDAAVIEKWIQDKDVFRKWGGELFGEFPITADIIDNKYRANNGDCTEPDNFYPWVAYDENGAVGHFIMRYLNGDNRIIRFGWVVVDNSIRGKGYGKEMLSLGLKYAFDFLQADKITIGVYEDNDIAHNCYKSLGFTDTGITEKKSGNVIEMEVLRK